MGILCSLNRSRPHCHSPPLQHRTPLAPLSRQEFESTVSRSPRTCRMASAHKERERGHRTQLRLSKGTGDGQKQGRERAEVEGAGGRAGTRRSSGSVGGGHGARVEDARGWIRAVRYRDCAGGGQRLREGGGAGLCWLLALSVVSMAGLRLRCRSPALSSPCRPSHPGRPCSA